MEKELTGTKRLVVGAHYGTLDFAAQRVTAIIMAVYTIVLLAGILFLPDLSFQNWRRLFNFSWGALPVGQMLATLAFLAVCWHAWIGVRDIWMDYIRGAGLRLFLQVLTILWLVASIAYFAKILWSL